MRSTWGLHRTSIVCLLTLAAPACTDDDPHVEWEGQCEVDADCVPDLSYWTEPLGTVELVGAACERWASMAQPVCNCQLLRTPSANSRGIERPYVFSTFPGNRPGGCSEYGRAKGCIYCESEFPGCNIDDPASCAAVCSDFARREAAEFARTFPVSLRASRCNERQECTTLVEFDGRCYVGNFSITESRSYDCAASDEELFAQPANAFGGNSCPSRAVPP
jgi:hypothetical protein